MLVGGRMVHTLEITINSVIKRPKSQFFQPSLDFLDKNRPYNSTPTLPKKKKKKRKKNKKQKLKMRKQRPN
jgi:hypothetical protein